MKRISIILYVAILSFLSCLHIEAISRDSILSDFDTFVTLLEDTHPDPYSSFGGRPFFYEKVEEFRSKLLYDSVASAEKLHKLAGEFISILQDGHTFINMPPKNRTAADADSLLMIKFMYGAGTLFVNVISEKDSILLGSRLLAVNGVPLEKIVATAATIYSCENQAARYACLSDYFRTPSFYRTLTETEDGPVVFNLLTAEGTKIDYQPEAIHYNEFGATPKSRTPESGPFPKRQMEWCMAGKNMVFRLSSVMARENFEYQYRNGWDFYDQLAYYYRNAGVDMPTDTLEAIESVPSMSESFMNMLEQMKEKGVKNLVVDLRGNGGGWTPIVLPTLYMMYGDKYLDSNISGISGKIYRRISDLYLKKINTTIDGFNAANGSNLKIGDYTIYEGDADDRPLEQRRDDFLRMAFCTDLVRNKLRALDGHPLYTPDKVLVITDERTFSAAFHYAFYLKKMGAIVAGEICSQAPNCYMEVTPFTLPNTGLSGSISNAMQVFLPADDPCAKEFIPDIRLSYSDYRQFDFDYNSILLHLLSR